MKRLLHPVFVLAAATLMIWGVTLTYGFVWDDFPMIASNSSLHEWGTFLSGWTHDFWMLHDSPNVSGYWRPIPTMFHAFLMQFSPGSAWVFHAFNVVLHGLTAFFFYRFLVHTKAVKWFWVSIFFFLWHPINAETVSFNSAIPDLLFAVFGWAALMIWTDEKLESRKRSIWTLICLILSFLSKESGVFFGIFLIGYEFFFRREHFKSQIRTFAAILGVIGVYVLLHLAVTKSIGAREIWGGSVSVHVATFIKLFVYELFLIFVPIGSSPTRDFALGAWNQWQVWLGCILLIAAIILMIRSKKSNPALAFSIFFYLVFWFPVSNIIPAEGLIADRYMYLPSMAVAFAVGVLFNRCAAFPKIFGFAMIGWGIWAVNHSLVWKDSASLWGHAVEVSPKSSVAWNEWGNVEASNKKYPDAYAAYTRALQLRPQYRDASFNQVLMMFLVGDPSIFIAVDDHFKKFGQDPQMLDLVGSIYESRKDFESAEDFSKQAVSAEPRSWKYRFNLASVYIQRKKYDEAVIELEKAYRIAPNRFEVIKNLAASFCLNAKYKECLKTYQEIVQKFPEKTGDVQFQMEQAKQLLELTQGS